MNLIFTAGKQRGAGTSQSSRGHPKSTIVPSIVYGFYQELLGYEKTTAVWKRDHCMAEFKIWPLMHPQAIEGPESVCLPMDLANP
jgi:hypothetical protein